MEPDRTSPAFSLWITGAPGAGKTTLVAALVPRLRKRGIDPVVLRSEFFRQRFSPHPVDAEEEREAFYRGMIEVAAMFVEHGVPVLIDATGMRRSYRTAARECLDGFAEVHVECPPELCATRHADNASRGAGASLPAGVVEPAARYETPVHPELVIHSDREDPESAAARTMDFLISSGRIPSRRQSRV
jgi:adenylylsulfate kinase